MFRTTGQLAALEVLASLQGYNMLYIEVKKLNENATVPTKAYESDAGWDLYASENAVVKAGDRAVIKTGISMSIPEGWAGLIWPRSGLSVKKGIDVLAGVIDSSYRGEIMVCLYNTSNKYSDISEEYSSNDLYIEAGDRIAQILFQQVPESRMIEVESLEETERNSGGFGSSGR